MPGTITRTVRIRGHVITLTADDRGVTVTGMPEDLRMTRTQALRIVDALEFVSTRAVPQE